MKISSSSRLRLKSKKDESRDCNQNQEKGMRREDYSRMVRFFDGELFFSSGLFPLSAMALGFSLEEEDERKWNDGCVCEWVWRAPERLFY
jgi:hypothetical protein